MPDERASSDETLYRAFAIFNEIGIVSQLGRTIFEARLPPGVLLPHFTLINHLVRVRDGQTPLAMARAFQLPKTTVSHMVSVVARHGWVTLRPNPEDGRSKRVWLTESGRAFRERAIRAVAPDLAEISAALGDTAQDDLLRQLTALRVYLDARRDDPNGSSG
ncbi:MarR family transcriptional regulator [Jannaschia sp. S6380]|uniref:MarR family winged helix-turn-helix transcriptional regulator n=1 Tax=Jannaschia sp. S6380 TaxID=2926408 RepID=UPI001FF64B3C|nr:MarR family transcriptional regulator [Jannaschia sp. S6380]MCK0169194.1 MarR family transcriptional regulator [Jannaschia sp. S6380]